MKKTADRILYVIFQRASSFNFKYSLEILSSVHRDILITLATAHRGYLCCPIVSMR